MKDGELFYAGTAEDLVSSMKEKVWQCIQYPIQYV